MHKKAVAAFLTFSATLTFTVAHATETISLTPDDLILKFGVPESSTYGQVFTTPTPDRFLSSYSFWLSYGTGSQITFQFYVAAWNGSDVTGSVLYSSNVVEGPTGQDQLYTFNPDINLNSGQQYMAFISTSNTDRTNNGEIYQIGSDQAYAGGSFLFLNNAGDSTQWYSASWQGWPVPQTAFTAQFTSTPAPGASLAMATGWILRYRRRARHSV